jgi:hypothetical protein
MRTINQDHAITAGTGIAPACAIGVHLDSFHPLDGIIGCKIAHRYLANASKDLKGANLTKAKYLCYLLFNISFFPSVTRVCLLLFEKLQLKLPT